MNVERGTFEGEETSEERAYWDAQIAATAEKAWQDPAYRAIFADPETSLARGRADAAAGRFHPHEIVAEWLKTWGKPGRKPFQDWLNDRG